MRIGELKEIIKHLDDNCEIFIKQNHIVGNIKEIASAEESSYGFFGKDIPCLILTTEYKED